MLVKNIFAVFAIAGMAAAYPAEDYEFEARDALEERTGCPPGHNWCCQNSVPFSILWFSGEGSNCKQASGNYCPPKTSPLCCQKGQIVSNGKDGAQVVCLK